MFVHGLKEHWIIPFDCMSLRCLATSYLPPFNRMIFDSVFYENWKEEVKDRVCTYNSLSKKTRDTFLSKEMEKGVSLHNVLEN